MRPRLIPLLGLVLALTAGCRAGTAPQELAQLRARASTLEAENAHLQGQVSLIETERDQLRQQVNTLATDLAKARAGTPAIDVSAGENLVVVPKSAYPGEWVAVHIRNYPARLLPQAAIALRAPDGKNLTHVRKLSAANVFLLPVPATVTPGDYKVVLGEAGELGPGAKLDDQVAITIRKR